MDKSLLVNGFEQALAGSKPVADTERTGFCGAWKDDRPADEFIADITAHRSGYGLRKVDL